MGSPGELQCLLARLDSSRASVPAPCRGTSVRRSATPREEIWPFLRPAAALLVEALLGDAAPYGRVCLALPERLRGGGFEFWRDARSTPRGRPDFGSPRVPCPRLWLLPLPRARMADRRPPRPARRWPWPRPWPAPRSPSPPPPRRRRRP